MKRHPGLQDLSRDHHGALIQAREIDRHLRSIPGAPDLERLTASFLAFWETEAEPHFWEEEQLLFPILTSLDPEAEPLIDQAIEQHTHLRRQVARLRQQVEAGEGHTALLGRIGKALHDHVRFEERVLFQRAQERLPPAELERYGERSLAFRKRWRGPAAIGPNRPG